MQSMYALIAPAFRGRLDNHIEIAPKLQLAATIRELACG
jgi:hypothetical protein